MAVITFVGVMEVGAWIRRDKMLHGHCFSCIVECQGRNILRYLCSNMIM